MKPMHTAGLAPTPFVVGAVDSLPPGRLLAVLDLGCGQGRHAGWLASRGHHVTGVDLDESCAQCARGSAPPCGRVVAIVADGTRALPFRAGSFDLALLVHFAPPNLIGLASPVLRPGAYLIVETFGGHGGNWRALPRPGQFQAELGNAFDVLDYREQLVGPTKTEAVSVKFVARKR